MALRQWKLQDAKNHFSEVVEHAIKDGPQEVTRHGEHAVVILSFKQYHLVVRKNLVDFFKESPFYGMEFNFETQQRHPREVEF